MLHLYNTESHAKEKITLAQGAKRLTMYMCGPTVYDYAHIGNLRTYVVGDLLRRAIKYFGFPLVQVMNLTDVDDKTIRGALGQGLSLEDYTQRYKQAFFEDLATLEVAPVEIVCAATETIGEMIEMIEILLDKKIAYRGKTGGVYYNISRFSRYGRLSRLKLEELKKGGSQRLMQDEYDKESFADFVLWKPYDPQRDGSIFWESPFGKGRPGWHIECSAMARHHLGEEIDIHVGGVDTIFPHHENEIAQSEGCHGKRFVRYWIHGEHLIVNGKKMAKSLGNFYTLRDLLGKGYMGAEVRYLLISTHYRTRLNFTFEALEGARQTLRRLATFIDRLQEVQGGTKGGYCVDPLIDRCRVSFSQALADDLNISVALATVFALVTKVNSLLDHEMLATQEKEKVLLFFEELARDFAIFPFKTREIDLPLPIRKAWEKREKARIARDWDKADKERDFIESHGFFIEDHPSGSRIKKR